MKFENIENIIVWQKAKTLALETSASLVNCKDPLLKEMTRKSAITLMNTIAEWFEKKNKKELSDCLYFTKEICGAYRSMVHLCLELGFLDASSHQKLIDASIDVTKLLCGFIKRIREDNAKKESETVA